jgi:uncharacterized RDD family membrane protein YckC
VAAPEKLTIETPEQITVEFPLAGIGSRFLAIAFDTLLQAAAAAGLVLVGLVGGALARASGVATPPSASVWLLALLIFVWFVIYTGYFAVFESIWNGQTPGKRLVGLRVIDAAGGPVTVYASILRNLLRLIDQLPGFYAVGIISVLCTERQQRLGDIAADTVVVHERLDDRIPAADPTTTIAALGAHKLDTEDIVLIDRFLARRGDLDSVVRRDAARRIAERMAGKLRLPPGSVEDEEELLERLAAEYRAGGRYGLR